MKRNHQLKPTARFRYWTRKAYAAFSSLGRCVTIGQLRKNVTEQALTKQTAPDVLAIFDGRSNQTDGNATDAIAHIMPQAAIGMIPATLFPQIESTYAEPYGFSLYTINYGRDALSLLSASLLVLNHIL